MSTSCNSLASYVQPLTSSVHSLLSSHAKTRPCTAACRWAAEAFSSSRRIRATHSSSLTLPTLMRSRTSTPLTPTWTSKPASNRGSLARAKRSPWPCTLLTHAIAELRSAASMASACTLAPVLSTLPARRFPTRSTRTPFPETLTASTLALALTLPKEGPLLSPPITSLARHRNEERSFEYSSTKQVYHHQGNAVGDSSSLSSLLSFIRPRPEEPS